ARAVALDDEQTSSLDPLVGRESGAAGRALAAATDGRGVVEVTRIDDARVLLAADGASHTGVGPPLPLAVVVWRDHTTTCGRKSLVAHRCEAACPGGFRDVRADVDEAGHQVARHREVLEGVR